MEYGCHIYDSASKTVKDKLNVIQNTALRLATGAIKNTNILKLEVEANVPPLQMNRVLNSVKYGSKVLADTRHPTRECINNKVLYIDAYTNDRPFSNRLEDMCTEYGIPILNIDNKCTFSIPPWVKPNFKIDFSVHNRTKAATPVEELRNNSLVLISKFAGVDKYYTDGSVKDGRTGIGVFNDSFSICQRLPDNLSIFTAEAQAIFMSLRKGIQIGNAFAVFSDSYSVLSAIYYGNTDHTIITRILNILYHSSIDISLCWIPSHCGVLGNEQADRLANRASARPNISVIKYPRKDFLNIVKTKIRAKWQTALDRYPYRKYKSIIGEWSTSSHPNRLREVVLARLRMNNVKCIHLVAHIDNIVVRCTCDGSRLTLKHLFFYCNFHVVEKLPILNKLRDDNKDFTVQNLLIDDDSYCNLVYEYLKSINALHKI